VPAVPPRSIIGCMALWPPFSKNVAGRVGRDEGPVPTDVAGRPSDGAIGHRDVALDPISGRRWCIGCSG